MLDILHGVAVNYLFLFYLSLPVYSIRRFWAFITRIPLDSLAKFLRYCEKLGNVYWLILFWLSVVGFLSILPIYFLSLEHVRLRKVFGERSTVVGNLLGVVSGWGFFVFWAGIWISPQPRFNLDPLGLMLKICFWDVPGFHLLVASVFFLPGVYFGVRGVMDLGLETSETHRPEKVVTSGVYSRVRHPQYLGGILGHFSMTFLFSGLYSLYLTPLVVSEVMIICWKEEKELIREFGREYQDYRERVPMLLPSFKD